MKRKIALVIFSFLFSIQGFSQVPDWLWAKGMGGTGNDEALSIAIDNSGNIYTIGNFENTVDFDPGPGIFNLTSFGLYDVIVYKSDASGNFIWAKVIGGSGIDEAISVALDISGNVYTTGFFNGIADFDPGTGVFNLTSAGMADMFVSKLDSSGNFIWAKQIGGPLDNISFSLAIDTAGGGYIYTTGSLYGTADFDPGPGTFNLTANAPYDDVFISKLDSSGNFIWAKLIGGANDDRGKCIVIDPSSGDVYTTGYFANTVDFDPGTGVFNLTAVGGVCDIFISKLDSGGNFLWAKRMGGGVQARGFSMTLNLSGDIFTTGMFTHTADFDPGAGVFNLTAGGGDIFVSRLDSMGNFIWAKRMGGLNADVGNSIALDISGNVYTTGYFQSTSDFDPGVGIFNLTTSGSSDTYVSKLDSLGNFIWAKQVGGTSLDEGRSISVAASGNLYLCGYFQSPVIYFDIDTLTNIVSTGTVSDLFVAKLDTSSGIPTTNKEMKNSSIDISLSPNPATTSITIERNTTIFVATLTLLDCFGRKVSEKIIAVGEKNAFVDVRNISAGIYFVSLRDEKSSVARKVVVQH